MNFKYILLCAILFSCQSATKYKSAEQANSEFGFSETKLGDNFYRVSFEGNYNTEKETVESYMLYRVAELAKQNKKKFIKFLDKEVEKDQRVVKQYLRFRQRSSYGFTYYENGLLPRTVRTSKKVKENYKATSYVVFSNKKKEGSLNAAEILSEIKPSQ